MIVTNIPLDWVKKTTTTKWQNNSLIENYIEKKYIEK